MPALLWAGPEIMAPDCPSGSESTPSYEGYADWFAPECGSCACEQPTGQCEMSQEMTLSTATCAGSYNEMVRSAAGFDLDLDVCNTENGVEAAFGAHSVQLYPVKIVETGCKPVEIPPTPKVGSAVWGTFARACESTAPEPCLDSNPYCVPFTEPPPEFSSCIHRAGEHDCPSAYPEKRVFHDDVGEAPACSACSCGPPVGSVCEAYLMMYKDASCTDPLDWGGVRSDLDASALCDSWFGPSLHPLLGKKVASLPAYESGSCEPHGGEVVGSPVLLGPTTFCCQGDEEGPLP
jgi:hypothetical protein